MVLLLISLVAGVALAWALFWYAEEGCDFSHSCSALLGVIISAFVVLSVIGYSILGFSWLAAEKKASIVNREYGTNYTQAEFFYASDVIETVRQLDRKRIEVNGDLMRDEKKGD